MVSIKKGNIMSKFTWMIPVVIGISLISPILAENVKQLTVGCLKARNADFKCNVHFGQCPEVPGLSLIGQEQNPCSDQNSVWVKVDDPNTLMFTTDGKDNVVDTTPTNPFHGWWATITKGNNFSYDPTFSQFVQADVDSYIFIDTAKKSITITTTAGTNLEPRQPTNLDLNPTDPAFLTYTQVDATTLTGNFNELGLTGSEFNQFPDSFALKLQPDSKTIISTADFNPFATLQTIATKLVKVDAPKLRPFGESDVNFKGDVNDPVFLIKYIFDQLLHMGNPQNATYICNPALVPPQPCDGNPALPCNPLLPQPVDCDFVGFRQAYDTLEQLLDEGITVTTHVTKIRPTNNAFGQLVTDIYTDAFSLATPGATVTIDGFTGNYAALNGTYINGVSYLQFGGAPNPSGLHVDYAQNAQGQQTAGTYPFHFLLSKDTSNTISFPRVTSGSNVGLGIFTTVPGGATVTVTHRVHSNMEYPEFEAAVFALTYKVWRVSEHSWFTGFWPAESVFLFDNFNQLQAAVKAGTALTDSLRTNTSTLRPSLFYNNPALNTLLTSQANNYMLNDPFGVRPDAAGNWPAQYNYDIVLNNYLEDAANLYWALDGVPSGPWVEVQENVQNNFGYKSNINPSITGAKTFVGAVAPYFPVSTILDPNFYTLMGGSLAIPPSLNSILSAKNEEYFGRIKPSLTGGKNIGYIRLLDFDWFDPFGLMISGFFDPTDGASPKFDREALSRVLSAMMHYIVTDLQSEAVIIDTRGNAGGLGELGLALAEFFGDTRPGVATNASYKDDGTRPLDQLQDPTKYTTANNVLAITRGQYATLQAGYNNIQYPGSVFQGGKVIILTDVISASAGNTFPNFFLGANLNKDIGANTTVEFIGDIDGRLKGFGGEIDPMPVSQNSSFLTDASGNPVSPINVGYDICDSFFPQSVVGTNYYINQQTPVTAIDAAPLKGTAGGNPLPNDWPQTVWPDLGFIAPYPYTQLPGEPTPVPGTQSSWNDVWLRQAIFVALS